MMKLLKTRIIAILLILPFLLPLNFQCSSKIMELPHNSQEPDYWPTKMWRSSSPKEQNVNSEKLQEMYEYINSTPLGTAGMRSILIIRNGYIIYENYFNNDYNENRSYNIYSCTKSITSALIGITIEEEFIGSVEDRVLDYFPNQVFKNLDARKKNMTLEDLLTMTSGLSWDEKNYNDPDNDFILMCGASDAVQYVLDKPMVVDPGTTWVYNGGCSHLLSTIINKTTSIGTQKYAQIRLFDPLGIDAPSWTEDQKNIPNGAAHLRLTARQMAKFGFLYLNNGTWEGKQIVPADWVTRSTQVATSLQNEVLGYGYQWWISPYRNSYSARGYLGQYILVMPDYNLIIVFTARSNTVGYDTLINEYIIPALGFTSPALLSDHSKNEIVSFIDLSIFFILILGFSITIMLFHKKL
ncbi:MAG: serine hydrolase domain-containing protein [Promethearchaeota archaeon]